MLFITVFGLFVALAAILTGQALEGGSWTSLLQPSALLIVVGGTVGAVLVQSTPNCVLRAVRMLRWLVRPPSGVTREEIDVWSSLADIARKKGVVKLDSALTAADPFMRKALELVADNYKADVVREQLQVELTVRSAHLRAGAKVWESAAGYAPTIGILGSVLGLLHVMESLQDPTQLGSGIAVAFVATVYGLATANMLYLPIAHKLKVLIAQQVLRDEMRIEAATAILAGDTGARMRLRLMAYLDGCTTEGSR